ncbi:unnamed protein product [Candidula unifasciata]|uniref:Reverse transcriptase domain-containing protein n=1 Tax=Candidula unifasciata TaxID=100452 RepID=A0A8S3ZZP4_9EUPU|nr:unnamed protein product [Candidula unifasciata]
MERVLATRLQWFLETNHKLDSAQTGYRQHRSTDDQVAYLTQDIENGFQEKKKTLTVFFDMSKAFDKVWKDGLMLKLLHSGIRGRMYYWIQDFLSHRRASVKLDEAHSPRFKLRAGVPQGSVLSPVLFLIYINDLPQTLPRHVSHSLHADDLAVWYTSEFIGPAISKLQESVNSVINWANKWGLEVNRNKTVATLFSLSTKEEKFTLKFNNDAVPRSNTPTFLGVKLDSRLTWKHHILETNKKAMRKQGVMKKLAGTTWGADSCILKQVYTGTVRPTLEYASSSWITAAHSNKQILDKTQNRSLRTILGAIKSTPIVEMEKAANIIPLEERRRTKAILHAEKK